MQSRDKRFKKGDWLRPRCLSRLFGRYFVSVPVPFFDPLFLPSFQKGIVEFGHSGSNQLSQVFVRGLGVLPV